ncbi:MULTISPECIES: isoprenoid biosynthesis glyoxalase ElbB [Halomonadaceae]|uniref:isoprenoid biosynthesis glyoxalase ElbB n=1 Tax=Halomonadaceae TaxID=28256 RepID=UPI00159A9B15|nr:MULTISPECIES: isoprenoid biosynthesis glyoxalase ElbB [Halomonas]QJQ95056.1 isoprenoid biosynthesis glyoxalase ElbB [Halomonas sp. PA5]
MSKQVAIILSGCGVQDGAEIYESTLAFLRLDQLGIGYRCFAPDIAQAGVVNHLTGEAAESDNRNVLTESARLARGEIDALEALDPDVFDALLLPGGFGVARNLSNFAEAGVEMEVLPLLKEKVLAFHQVGKPLGLMCIAPVLVPRLLGSGIPVTIGHDPAISGVISAMGGLHRSCKVDDIIVDFENKVVTTPAYMLAERISDAAKGIFKLVDKLDELSND